MLFCAGEGALYDFPQGSRSFQVLHTSSLDAGSQRAAQWSACHISSAQHVQAAWVVAAVQAGLLASHTGSPQWVSIAASASLQALHLCGCSRNVRLMQVAHAQHVDCGSLLPGSLWGALHCECWLVFPCCAED